MIWILITAVLALIALAVALLPRRRNRSLTWRIDDPVVVERQVYARLYGERRNGHVEPAAPEPPERPEPKIEFSRERIRAAAGGIALAPDR